MRFNKLKNLIDSQKIENSIADFENELDFEFIPVFARKSSYVEHVSWLISLIFLVVFMGVVDYLFANYLHDSWMSPLPFFIAGPFFAVICGAVLEKFHVINRIFITKAERARQVQEKAERFFYKKQLHELKSKNALILYVSLMERQIVLYHDPRISFDNMSQISQELLKILQESFRIQEFENGLLSAIAHLKTSLTPHFSYGNAGRNAKKGENMVPNKLIWWDE